MHHGPPGVSCHALLQGSSWPRGQTHVSHASCDGWPPQTLSTGCQLGIRRQRIQDLFLPSSIPGPRRWPRLSTASAPDSSPSSSTPILIRFLYIVSFSSDFTGSNSFQHCSFLDASPYFVASLRAAHSSVNSLFLEHYFVYPFWTSQVLLADPWP